MATTRTGQELYRGKDWIVVLHFIKTRYRTAYQKSPHLRASIKENFARTLARFYGSNPNDPDILEEVRMELLDIE